MAPDWRTAANARNMASARTARYAAAPARLSAESAVEMDGLRTEDESPPPLDGFTFGRCLGHGGMATVWEAYQKDPGRVVAVKVLNDDISSRPQEIDSFYAEAKTAASLDHPNIVPVLEVGVQRGRYYYYVMELASGYDTGKWLARKGRLPEADVLTIAESVAVALDYASKTLGIIHCDVKPANIMVDGDGMVRITDMGLARLRRTADNEYITGTPAYMSPEQASGSAAMDERSDIYSLGATIYHLLAGHAIFPGKGDEETMKCQCSVPAPDIREANPDVSPACAALLARFLAKSPAERPQSWAEAIAMIHAVMEGKPLPGPAAPVSDATVAEAEQKPATPVTGPAMKPSAMAQVRRRPQPSRQPDKAAATSVFWFITLLIATAAFAVAFAAARFLPYGH